jgi:hypothetical protein
MNHPLIPSDLPPDERMYTSSPCFHQADHFSSLMMSMIVAQISSGTGLVSSVGGEETMNWGRLALASLHDLSKLSSKHQKSKKIAGQSLDQSGPEPDVE